MKLEPWTYAFKIFGKRVQRFLPHFEGLHNQLKKGGVKIALTAYLSFMILASIIAFIIPVALLPFLLPSILRVSFFSAENFILSLMFALLAAVSTFILIYAYPGMKSSNRKVPIELNLPYISSFMACLLYTSDAADE